MNIKKRIVCLFKGHEHTLTIYLNSCRVNAECTRCDHRLTEQEALWILKTSTIKEIE